MWCQKRWNQLCGKVEALCKLMSLQLEFWTGHRGVHPLGTEWTVSTLVPFPTLKCCEGGMEGMDGMGCLVPAGHKDKGGILEQQALRVPVGHKDKREILEALKVLLAHKDEGGWLEQQALRVRPAQGVVAWSTQGEGKLAVQVSQELSWCMQGGLVEAIMCIREEQPTTSACLMIQTTSAINLEFKVTAMCMEQSMNHTVDHSQLLLNTMFPVLCAMLQRGWQSQ